MIRKYLGQGRRFVRRFLNVRDHTEAILAQYRSLSERLPQVRIAVAGAGRHARRHLEVLSAMANVDLVGICNRGNSDITALAQQYRVAQTFDDYRIMLDVTRPDGVIVAVSHFETVSVAAECLTRRIPCLIEKPAGFTSDKTARLATLANENHCLNMVGVNRRFLSVLHQGLSAILQEGPLIGIVIEAPEAIRRIRTEGRFDPRLYDLWFVGNSIHCIDLFRCIGGEVDGFCGFKNSWEERNGDSFTAIMRLSSGCLGTFVAHWHAGGSWSIKLYGDGVRVEISLAGNTSGEIYRGKRRFSIPVDPIDRQYKPGLYVQDQTFVKALALGETLPYPASDLNDAVKTMQLIEQIEGGL